MEEKFSTISKPATITKSGGEQPAKNYAARPKQRYKRQGSCKHCGACCLAEDPACKYLLMENGKSHCIVFGKPERYKRCLLFPENPPIPFEGCGFFFVDRWEGNRKVEPKKT